MGRSIGLGCVLLVACQSGAPQGTEALGRADVVLVGESAPEWGGTPMSSAGDVNGDGIGDVIVGNEYAEGGGAAYVVYGPLDRNARLFESPIVIRSTTSDAELGLSVAGVGDINDDGFDDIAVGAPALNSEETSGKAYVFFGPLEAGVTLDDADVVFGTSSPFDWVGHSLGDVGDVTGDGVADLLIGATPFFGSQAVNAAYVFHGPLEEGSNAAVAAQGAIYSDTVGYIMKQARYQTGAGDVNGDGIHDIAIGGFADGSAEAGKAYVFHGPIDAVFRYSEAELTVEGDVEQGNLGLSIAALEDFDGDGTSDLLVGAPGYTDPMLASPGGAYLLPGDMSGTTGLENVIATFGGEGPGDLAGFDVDSAGDVDGDGLADILVAAPTHLNSNGSSGNTYLFYGPVEGFHFLGEADAEFPSSSLVGGSGAWSAGLGDVTGDGYDDIGVGGYIDRTSGGQIDFEPTVFIFFGGVR